MTAATPIYGLVLAGGRSSRMQRDKAALAYEGRGQLDRAFELMARHVERAFISVRDDQRHDTIRADKPQIIDSVDGEGPIVGIRSALAAHPQVAWLVLACDLPYLTDATLDHLIAQRDADKLATAYLSAHDGLPEPLCAIWEPAAAAALTLAQQSGVHCPRKFLIRHATHLVELRDPRALDNVNTPDDYTAAVTRLQASQTADKIPLTVQYFALMREQAGCSEESIESTARTPSALYDELKSRHPFTLPPEQLKVAVNSEFADWSRPLNAGDSVVFIPPVAGG